MYWHSEITAEKRAWGTANVTLTSECCHIQKNRVKIMEKPCQFIVKHFFMLEPQHFFAQITKYVKYKKLMFVKNIISGSRDRKWYWKRKEIFKTKQHKQNETSQRDEKSTLRLFIDTHKSLTLYLSFWYVGKWLKTPLLKHHVSISTTLLKLNFAFFV